MYDNEQVYLFGNDGRVITCTFADLHDYSVALERGRHLSWSPLAWGILGPGKSLKREYWLTQENALLLHNRPNRSPVFIVGTPQGPVFASHDADGQASITLDSSLAGYTNAFTTYHDAAGEWLVLGGKDGLVMLPISVISSSLNAAMQEKR